MVKILKSLLIVDCQNDFINGTLACKNGQNAVDEIVHFINSENCQVFYSRDWHRESNKSFACNGGTWPIHCVQETKGAELHWKFGQQIKCNEKRPNKQNIFSKGVNDDVEEYSAYNAVNSLDEVLNKKLSNEVIVCGIATDFCVKETIKQLVKNGFHVSALEKGLAYVTNDGHRESLSELREIGVRLQ